MARPPGRLAAATALPLVLGLLLLLAGRASGYDNAAPLSRTPMMGWSSWVALGPGSSHPELDFCDAASIMAAADAMVQTGLVAAGYTAFHLDDCWAGSRNASGHLEPESGHFPGGMRPVIEYAKSKGLSFGLYTDRGNLSCVRTRPGSQGHFEQDAATFAEWGVECV
jgi:alpha-galactosidase|eukprot:COSAG06_NODE_8043_length_2290_cov_3.596531_2_plen_167_part_00